MHSYRVDVWWGCKQRPFGHVHQTFYITAEDEADAVCYGLRRSHNPLLHMDTCCYAMDWDVTRNERN